MIIPYVSVSFSLLPTYLGSHSQYSTLPETFENVLSFPPVMVVKKRAEGRRGRKEKQPQSSVWFHPLSVHPSIG